MAEQPQPYQMRQSIKQKIGVLFIGIVLASTVLAIAGIWGFIKGDTAWQLFYTLIAVAIGLGVSGGMLDTFFPDPDKPEKPIIADLVDTKAKKENE